MAFEFDRYINGELMAEGVTIERQRNLPDAMREAARIVSRGPNGEVPVLVLRALAERAGGVKGEWHRADGDKSILLYTLRQDGWRKGEAVMVNDVTVRIEAANGSESPIEPIASAILSALTTEPAAPEGRQEAASPRERGSDARVYSPENAVQPQPEQAVTEAMTWSVSGGHLSFKLPTGTDMIVVFEDKMQHIPVWIGMRHQLSVEMVEHLLTGASSITVAPYRNASKVRIDRAALKAAMEAGHD